MRPAKEELDALLERHGVQPVGNGYIDCICPREEAGPFLKALRSAGIAVTDYSLWQYVPPAETAVLGMGGPPCRYRAGWYSELNVLRLLRPWRGEAELEAFLTAEEGRLGCTLAPGFCLEVPEDWRSPC